MRVSIFGSCLGSESDRDGASGWGAAGVAGRALVEGARIRGQRPAREFLRVKEVARRLGVSGSLVFKLLNEGKLPGLKLANVWLIPKAEFEGLLERLRGAREAVEARAAEERQERV